MSEVDWNSRVIKDIERLFGALKSIEISLITKEKQIVDEFKVKSHEIDSTVWNDYGIWFLRNGDFSSAELVYKRLLDLEKILTEKDPELHKGLPLYNMGIAQIKQRNFDEGIQNILRAYEEDIRTHGKAKAQEMLAFKLKEGLSNFISKAVDNNYLPEFNRMHSPTAKSTSDLMKNMEEAEELLFLKTINSTKSLGFHDDIYTKVVLLDNIKNLAMLIEYNIRRRSKRKVHLSEADEVFPTSKWAGHFRAYRTLTSYKNIPDFEGNMDGIKKLTPSGDPATNFFLRNFLTAALIRNFVAHYLDENLQILSSEVNYNEAFNRVVHALLYTLSEKI